AVSFTAACDGAAYHWDFGDGGAADGQAAAHTFGAGRFAVTLTVTQADGSTATERLGIDSLGLTLSARRSGRYGRPILFRGRLVPGWAGQVTVRIWKSGKLRVSRTYAHGARIPLDTARAAAYRVEVTSIPSRGFARAGRVFSTRLFLPTLRPGAAGPTVARLVSALGSLHYAVRRSSSFGAELVDSLY